MSFENLYEEYSKTKRVNAEVMELPEEFMDVYKVLTPGAVKYGPNSWLKGIHFDHCKNHVSMGNHLIKSAQGIRLDDETGLDHLLHIACRALMQYTLIRRGLLDKKEVKFNVTS